MYVLIVFRCVAGYTGNPLKVGDYCKQGILCDCDQRGTVPNTECDQATKQCQCKVNIHTPLMST
ncbi:hypothetical protein DPMN_129151 [Dreissena polymorpha]|uniref:Uncharacterized protein n=1 Tax=Dreissena polymorpha TaxID=45954 RepID=A0A9D4H0P7_DREPO|nr:hypothetical protein DPMN_129151 [Dreissena polymorpha]